MLAAQIPLPQKLIAQRASRERECLRRLLAHKVLLEQLRQPPRMAEAEESNGSADELQHRRTCSEEEIALDAVIERLILDDLTQQEQLDRSAGG